MDRQYLVSLYERDKGNTTCHGPKIEIRAHQLDKDAC